LLLSNNVLLAFPVFTAAFIITACYISYDLWLHYILFIFASPFIFAWLSSDFFMIYCYLHNKILCFHYYLLHSPSFSTAFLMIYYCISKFLFLHFQIIIDAFTFLLLHCLWLITAYPMTYYCIPYDAFLHFSVFIVVFISFDYDIAHNLLLHFLL